MAELLLREHSPQQAVVMKIKHSVPHSPRQLGRRSAAFSLVEVTVGMAVIGTAVVALFDRALGDIS